MSANPTSATRAESAKPPGGRVVYLSHWSVIAGLILVIVVTCVSLWRFPLLRPYLAGFGAGLAAFLAPLPGLITPDVRGKWVIAIGLAGIIGLGTWYSSNAIEEERDRLALKVGELGRRLGFQRGALRDGPLPLAIEKLPVNEQQAFLTRAAVNLRTLDLEGRHDSVLNLAEVLGALDPANGHALYYEGQAYFHLRERTKMRGAFQKYLQESDHQADSKDGDAAKCYQRPSGYCRERVAWIEHLMAYDYYREAMISGSQVGTKVSGLGTALSYEQEVLQLRSHGFYRIGSIDSSCELLRELATEIRGLGRDSRAVDVTLARYQAQYGPC
jgi:hypothetical protein